MHTLLLQYSTMPSNEPYLVGEVTPEQASEQFTKFPWAKELREFQDKELHAPTYRLKSRKNASELVISAMTEENFYVSLKDHQKKKKLGIFPSSKLEVYSAYGLTYQEAQGAVRTFVTSNVQELIALLNTKTSLEDS